jgi:hypothetical protein
MSSSTTAATVGPTATPGTRRAVLMVDLALLFLLAASVIGLGWDRRWHTTRVLVSFYSPPHIFIYTVLALTMSTIAVSCCRRHCGPISALASVFR